MSKKLKPIHQQIKHWFVPHKHNDHRPHLIRLHGLAVVAFLIIGIQVTFNLTRPAAARVLAYATDITPSALLSQTNQQRVSAGLAPLALSARLNQSASLKAANMFAENYWAHVSPSGIEPWHWFVQAGYNYAYAGENLAKDFDTSSGTMQGWMNSPGHRANILNSNYTEVGFAVQNGTLTSEQTTLVVAHYGAPAGGTKIAATVVAPTPKPAAKAVVPVVTTAPVVAPEPSVAPSPSLAPSTSPIPVVASAPKASPSAPAPKAYSLFMPLSLVRTLNWGTLATIALLILLLVVYAVTHVTVWRKGLKRWRTAHYKLFAATSVSGLVIAIIALAVSGFGQVG